ncbi:hypothetical protein ACFY7Z_14420 [Streptomyces sp. NPDC012623]|uniref:hypothetical protein n=1 Tax=unclassified Streptomyces TaxID=2593676 RepID=UPI0036BC6275
MVAEHVERAPDPGAALAAVRIIGADAFAPAVLAGAALHARDAEAVAQSFTALPAANPAPAPPDGPETAWLMAWRDWGTVTLLTVLNGRGADGVTAARPAAPAGIGGSDWASWSVRMGQLCTLALPGLDGPVHEAARAAPLGLARGATRAALRRDYSTAARIARWLAWLHAEGVELPLDPAPLVEHIALMAAGDRTALDTAIARRLLTGGPSHEPSDRTGT